MNCIFVDAMESVSLGLSKPVLMTTLLKNSELFEAPGKGIVTIMKLLIEIVFESLYVFLFASKILSSYTN